MYQHNFLYVLYFQHIPTQPHANQTNPTQPNPTGRVVDNLTTRYIGTLFILVRVDELVFPPGFDASRMFVPHALPGLPEPLGLFGQSGLSGLQRNNTMHVMVVMHVVVVMDTAHT